MFPLRDSTHLNYLSQNVTFSHLLFGRVSLGRKTIFLDTVYSLFTIHLLIPIRTFHFSLFTQTNRFYTSAAFSSNAVSISSIIIFAAPILSSADVIGLPTTIKSTPAKIASLGVSTLT